MTNTVGPMIKKARAGAGLTQEQLANKVTGLSASDISRAERGVLIPTQEQLKTIAKVTGVTQKSLLDAAKESKAESDSSGTSGSSGDGKKPSASTSTGSSKKPAESTSTGSGKKPAACLQAAGSESYRIRLKIRRSAHNRCSEAARSSPPHRCNTPRISHPRSASRNRVPSGSHP